jgi:uncharacterized membrane protein YkoI
MYITFEHNDKYCNCYQELIKDETNRDVIKRFKKIFNENVLKAALKLHKKLKIADNAAIYNATVSADNRIEKKQGQKKKEPLVLKVRIQDAYRKFFYYICFEEDRCTEDKWTGQFIEVKKIHVFEINKHNYNF